MEPAVIELDSKCEVEHHDEHNVEGDQNEDEDCRMSAGHGHDSKPGGKRVRTSGRKNRAWFKYCRSLPTHLKTQTHEAGVCVWRLEIACSAFCKW